MLFISIVFMNMAEMYLKEILEFSGTKLLLKRITYFVVAIIFNMGQAHFFLINGIVLIRLSMNGDTLTTPSFVAMQAVLEWCGLLLPLILGYFFIYLI